VNVVKQFEKVNRELWVVFSMFIIAAVMNFVVSGQRMVLAFYTLPTVFSAYHYGRRHATLTAFASVLLVVLLVWANPIIVQNATRFQGEQWLDIVVWGGILLVTGYTMGSLYEHKDKQVHELRETYLGILMILRQFISNDKYTENHSYRVSVYATKIAAQLNLDQERIEDIRAAALLHDIGKLDVSRQILYKAARLTEGEVVQMQEHVSRGAAILEPVGGSLRRVLPIILSHHDKSTGRVTRRRRARTFPSRRASSWSRTSSTRSRATARTARPWRRTRRARPSCRAPARSSTRRSSTRSSRRTARASSRFPRSSSRAWGLMPVA